MDLILHLDVLNDTIMNSVQHQTGALMYYVCDETRNLVNEWYDICCHYHYIDDSPSIHPNLYTFWEHRHDQSVFSLLTYKYDLYSKISIMDCIDYSRNGGGVSCLKE
jgi:hypothetical protein